MRVKTMHTVPLTSVRASLANPRALRNWTVRVHRNGTSVTLGQVNEHTEVLARLAALSKYGISEDEAEEGTLRAGIYPCDDFDVSPA